MLYMDIDTITFEDSNGISYPIKDIRPIPSLPVIFTITKNENEFIDEIVTRDDIYGTNREGDSFKVYDANAIKMVEKRFDFTKIKRLKVTE